jgi:hypothetical protein
VVWVGLDALAGMPLNPGSLIPYLVEPGERTGTVYLGTIDW